MQPSSLTQATLINEWATKNQTNTHIEVGERLIGNNGFGGREKGTKEDNGYRGGSYDQRISHMHEIMK